MTFQSAKNLKPHLALRKAVEINQKLDQSCLKLFCYTGGKQLYPYLKIGQLPYVTWNLKLLLGWVHALATQKDAQCSPALEGTRWERHLKSTPLNISRAIAAKIAAKSLQEPLQRKGQLVLCLEVSNQNKTRQALFGLLSVYGMRLVTNNSQEMRRPYVWLQHLRSNFTPLNCAYFFNNFTPRSRYMFMWSRPTAVTCKNESHLLRECWKCPIRLKSSGSENRNVQLF